MTENNTVPEHDESNLIFASRGTPYKSEALARSAIDKLGLDQNKHQVVSYEEGFAIKRITEVKKPEKYYWVVFQERANPEEEEDVMLSVNGEPIVIQRGKKVPIPARYKECADHTTKTVFRQMPNQPRMEVGTVKLFPYSEYGEASEEEYLEFKKEGNKITKQELSANRKLVE